MPTHLLSSIAPAASPAVPHATRARTPGWRDPRLWIGLLIVAVSVVGGARLLGAADDTVSVWTVKADIAPGALIAPDDLTSQRVRFAEASELDRYLRTSQALPADLYATRGIGAGELLPKAALGPAEDTGVVQVPVQVTQQAVPPSVRVGSVVDVYVTDTTAERGAPATLVFEGVTVTSAPRAQDGFGATGDRQLVLGIPADESDDLSKVLGAAASGTVTIVGRS